MIDDLEAQLMEVFRDEAREQLERLHELAQAIGSAEEDEGRKAAATAMRVAHTLKGATAAVGLDGLAELAHVYEDGLEALISSSSDALLRALGQGLAVLGEGIEGATLPGTTALPQERIAAAISTLRELTHATDPAAPKDATSGSKAKARPAADATLDAQPDQDSLQGKDHAPGTLRIGVELLDDIMSGASEVVVSGQELSSLQEELGKLRDALGTSLLGHLLEEAQLGSTLTTLDRLLSRHASALARLERNGRELNENVRKARLVPLDSLRSVWSRAADGVSKRLGKLVIFELVSRGIRLDKRLLDQLREPIIHLIRNAIDHGIEPLAERAAAGKDEVARLEIRAHTEGTRVTLSVRDDGAGIDRSRVRRAAQHAGLLPADADARLNDEQLLALLATPRFSTTDEVSEVSGRGVGLDAVAAAAAELGGTLSLTTSEGAGTTFSLSLPLVVASRDCVIVHAGGVTYAIPAESVVRSMRVKSAQIAEHEGRYSIQLDKKMRVPLVWLATHMGAKQTRQIPDTLAVLVVQYDGRRVGVAVDELDQSRTVVVRQLPWNLRGIRSVIGGCTLPRGGLGIVPDVASLLKSKDRQVGTMTARSEVRQKRVLVVDDSLTARTLARDALLSAGYEVTLARDGAEGWRLATEGDFQCVVTDVQMPRMDGFELTQRLRDDARLSRLPIILVTSRSTREDVDRGLEAGADEYVVKGALQQQKLLEAVARHL